MKKAFQVRFWMKSALILGAVLFFQKGEALAAPQHSSHAHSSSSHPQSLLDEALKTQHAGWQKEYKQNTKDSF